MIEIKGRYIHYKDGQGRLLRSISTPNDLVGIREALYYLRANGDTFEAPIFTSPNKYEMADYRTIQGFIDEFK